MRILVIAAAVVFGLTGLAVFTALAEDNTTAAPMDLPEFAALDADGDGALSLDEVKTLLPELDEQAFTEADADQTGGLNEEEFAVLVATMGGQ